MSNKKYRYIVERPILTYEMLYVEADSEKECLEYCKNPDVWVDSELTDYCEIKGEPEITDTEEIEENE